MNQSHAPLISRLSLAALLTLPAGAAVTAVSWGGQYLDHTMPLADDVPANRVASDKYGDPDGVFTIGANETIVGRALSTDSPFSPPMGYSGTSGTFYGGGSVTRTGGGPENDGFSELGILNQGPNDSIHFRVDTGGDSHTFHLLMFWDKANFLGSLPSEPNLTLGDGALTISTSQAAGNHSDELLRWVVRDGSQFYVSEATVVLTNNGEFSAPFASLLNWGQYNPVDPAGAAMASDLQSLDFDETGPFGAHAFTDVTGVGFYIEHESATGPINVHIEGFEASLVVPEPSSGILCLLGLGALTGIRRRR